MQHRADTMQLEQPSVIGVMKRLRNGVIYLQHMWLSPMVLPLWWVTVAAACKQFAASAAICRCSHDHSCLMA